MSTISIGMTIDDIEPIDAIIQSLQNCPKISVVRVVFDENVSPKYYTNALQKLKHSCNVKIMGEILDSQFVKEVSLPAFKKRVQNYVNLLDSYVDIWEVANEVNGEWLGKTVDVVAKMTYAHDFVKQKNPQKETAITLYYNGDKSSENACWSKSKNQWELWCQNIPERIRQTTDYALLSYYECDCPLKSVPNWNNVFGILGNLFPNSKLGFGETGTSKMNQVEFLLKHYYTMQVSHPRYIGGYFWWYFIRDMVPMTKNVYKYFCSLLMVN